VADVTVTPLGNGAYRVTDGTRSRLAYAVGPAHARWVFLEGRAYVVDVEESSPKGLRHASPADHRGRRGQRDSGSGALASPMPATVVKITVETGQRVSKGDVLIMLEAMKMELPITAPRDGAVKAIACRPGELVQPGVPLLELE
jgi:biotin carboxyl carrier protein